MRILMTADAVGGVWTYVITLAKALGRFDVRVSLAIMGPPPSRAQLAEAMDIPGLHVEYGPYRLEWMQDGLDDLDAAGRWLLDLEAREAPDVIHLNSYALAALPFAPPCMSVAHSCLCTWWRAVKHENPPSRFDPYRAAVHAGLEAATAVVAASQAMQDALLDAYALDERPVTVIHNGCDLSADGDHQKEPLVFSAGRFWDDAKNLALLDRAADRVTWPIVVAGADGDPVDASGPIQKLGRLERPEVLERLAHAAIYALPARYEPFGLSALEAARHGCALVLGDIPSLREIWGDAAVFVDPDSPEMLAAALNGLAADPTRLAHLARTARLRSARYSAEQMAAEYYHLYVGLCSETSTFVPLSDGVHGAGPRCAS